MNILCKIFGHEKMALWCQQEGWKCIRPGCDKKVIYREKPIEEWARIEEWECPTCKTKIKYKEK